MCLLPPLDLSRRFMYTFLSCLRFLGFQGRWQWINQRNPAESVGSGRGRIKGESSCQSWLENFYKESIFPAVELNLFLKTTFVYFLCKMHSRLQSAISFKEFYAKTSSLSWVTSPFVATKSVASQSKLASTFNEPRFNQMMMMSQPNLVHGFKIIQSCSHL